MSLTPGTNDLYRIGTDLLGSRQVPAYAYYGIHTLRAVENFQISGVPITNDVYPTAIKLALHFMAQHMLESAATCGCFPPGRVPG